MLSFLAPLWTIGVSRTQSRALPSLNSNPSGGFDASVHISEEASNARTAVPWAIISAVGIAGLLGWSMSTHSYEKVHHAGLTLWSTVVNIVIAFCMGTDLEGIMSNPIGQPMATVRALLRLLVIALTCSSIDPVQ